VYEVVLFTVFWFYASCSGGLFSTNLMDWDKLLIQKVCCENCFYILFTNSQRGSLLVLFIVSWLDLYLNKIVM
jgi:hypothetical protein